MTQPESLTILRPSLPRKQPPSPPGPSSPPPQHAGVLPSRRHVHDVPVRRPQLELKSADASLAEPNDQYLKLIEVSHEENEPPIVSRDESNSIKKTTEILQAEFIYLNILVGQLNDMVS
jgi:hypothetical protein